ncbi:DUF4232 domain-containing protein [Streptomyces antibioticus]|uniref:DUF4232 domain-containing protein n=1 Tax=Streptomyces antibioticus TaxID=1890 RepID=UPI0037B2FEB9
MRAVPITVTALAAALLLTACSGDDSGDAQGSDDGTGKAAGTACAAADLSPEVTANAAPAAGDSGNVTVTLTNKGAECVLDGFPAVGLVAGSRTAAVANDPAAEARKITLAEQGTTSFTITYVRRESGAKSLAVKTVRYGLPGAEETTDFAWSYGDVALTDEGEGDAPDASVSAFQQAGD